MESVANSCSEAESRLSALDTNRFLLDSVPQVCLVLLCTVALSAVLVLLDLQFLSHTEAPGRVRLGTCARLVPFFASA